MDQKKNIIKGICATKFCSRKPDGNRILCNTCRSKKNRSKDPVRYAYNNLKKVL